MTKQEQIEEMALEMPEEIKDPLDNSRYIIFGKSLRRAIANIYYNAGYRKIYDECAVITKDELKQYKMQAVKEFAEKLLNNKIIDYKIVLIALGEEIDKLLKEYDK